MMTKPSPELSLTLPGAQPNWMVRQAADHYIESLARSGTNAKKRAYHRGRFIAYVKQLLTTMNVEDVVKLFYLFLNGSDLKNNPEGEAVIRVLATLKGEATHD